MIVKLFKKADTSNKIFMPTMVIKKFGREFYMEIYEDKIILIPVKIDNK